MGGEAKNPTKHIPIAVIASLLIQGLVCYLFEYFAANYFLNSGYTMVSASGSAAPIGDMMIIVGDGLLGQGHGKYFMLAEAITVFFALIGTTLSCMNTGARVTYAMGKDDEAPEHFGILHAESLSPRKAIWTLAVISAVIGVIAVSLVFGDAAAPSDATIAALPHGIFSNVGYLSHDKLAALPNSLLTITLTSNFGTFILYALSCFLCIVAFTGRPDYNLLKHWLIPGFGLHRQPGLHGLLCSRPVLQPGHKHGTAVRARHLRRLGPLRRHLLHSIVQGEGQIRPARHQVGALNRKTTRRSSLGGISLSILCWRMGAENHPVAFLQYLVHNF